MLQRFLRWCVSWLLIFVAVVTLGCARLTLEALHRINPAAMTAVVCTEASGVDPDAEIWAENFDTREIVTDADQERLREFAPRAQAFYKRDPNAPAENLRYLRNYRSLTCPNESATLKRREEPKKVTIAIDDTLYAELFDSIDKTKELAKPRKVDPRSIAQPVEPRTPREPVLSDAAVKQLLDLMGRAIKSGSVAPLDADLDIRHDPVVQAAGGVVAGVYISFVPAGSIGADLAERGGVLPPQTKHFRIGKDIGQVLGGIGQVAFSCVGFGLGAGAASTGAGAPAGLVLTMESAAVGVNGLANICVGTSDGIQVMLHWGDDAAAGNAPASSSSPQTQQPTTQAPAPKPANSPPPPAQPPPPKPSGGGKAKGSPSGTATIAKVACTGQWHHAITKKIHTALENHDTLKGIYKHRDDRFLTQAIDKQAHNGYDKWHRDMEPKVIDWLQGNKFATPSQFENWLREFYTKPENLKLFPNGL